MSPPKLILAGCTLLLLVTFARACGPGFPQAFLPVRDAVLKAPIEGSFAFELGRYSSAIRSGKAAKNMEAWEPFEVERDKAEAKGVTAEQHRQIQRMRKAKDGDEAYKVGKGLPEATRLYTAAAVDLHAAKATACSNSGTQGACYLELCEGRGCYPAAIGSLIANPMTYRAIQRFEAVLALLPGERAPRATWAAYSLGEIYLNYKLEDRIHKARKYYALARELAQQGNPDPLNLAWSSLGQQALAYLSAGDIAAAVDLYMEQGDVNSLRVVAEKLVSQSEQKLKSDLEQRSLRRLTIAYAFSNGNSSPYTGSQPAWMASLVSSLIALGTSDVEDADRLAAISYQAANYGHAARLVEKSATPLAHWVKSKLARRNGAKGLAAEQLALACSDDQLVQKTLPSYLVDRLTIEHATALLARGESARVMADTYALGGGRWPDIAYIAERYLTADELREFVDRLPTRSLKARTLASQLQSFATSSNAENLSDKVVVASFGHRSTGAIAHEVEPIDTANQLRNLLARRLMREERHKSALRYFAQSDTKVIQYAKNYAAALKLSRNAKGRAARAEAHFKVGMLARQHGMEILGYELAPDFYYAKGNYGAGYVLGVGYTDTEGSSSQIYRKASMSKIEAMRFTATSPVIDRRYHYRYIAVDHARKAAALVPPRSQAYRALLCHAALWSPDDRLDADLYRTYIRNGSYMNNPLPKHFGRRCELPDFERGRNSGRAPSKKLE